MWEGYWRIFAFGCGFTRFWFYYKFRFTQLEMKISGDTFSE